MKTRRFSICLILVALTAGISIMALSNPVLATGPSDLERQGKVDDRLDPTTAVKFWSPPAGGIPNFTAPGKPARCC
jgi:hypothetical protein